MIDIYRHYCSKKLRWSFYHWLKHSLSHIPVLTLVFFSNRKDYDEVERCGDIWFSGYKCHICGEIYGYHDITDLVD